MLVHGQCLSTKLESLKALYDNYMNMLAPAELSIDVCAMNRTLSLG